METENKKLARRIIEDIWNKRNLDLFDQLFSPTFFNHDPAPGMTSDLAGLKQSTRLLLDSFPDLILTIDDTLEDGDKVLMRMTMRGSHQGVFFGIAPTGRTVSVPAYTILRIADSQIVERWGLTDMFGLLVQLGISSLNPCSE